MTDKWMFLIKFRWLIFVVCMVYVCHSALADMRREMREAQAELKRLQQKAWAERWASSASVVPQETAEQVPDQKEQKPPDLKTVADVERYIRSPEMVAQFEEMVGVFNKQLPEMNAMMASNSVPGLVFVPLKPLTTSQFQHAINAAVHGNDQLVIPQFEMLRRWQEAMLDKMTNRSERVTE